MASNGSDVKYFTAEGIKKMEEELDYLRSVKRGEVAEKIKVARSFGDLSENAEYDEARKEQAFMEGRIQELEAILSTAQVIREEDMPTDVVTVGSTVKVYNETRKKEQVYSLVALPRRTPSRAGSPRIPPSARRLRASAWARRCRSPFPPARTPCASRASPGKAETHKRKREFFLCKTTSSGPRIGRRRTSASRRASVAKSSPRSRARARTPYRNHALRPHPPFRADPARL